MIYDEILTPFVSEDEVEGEEKEEEVEEKEEVEGEGEVKPEGEGGETPEATPEA